MHLNFCFNKTKRPPPTKHLFIPLKAGSLRHVCSSLLSFTQEDCSIFGNRVKQEVEYMQKREESAQRGKKNKNPTRTPQTRCEISYRPHRIAHEKYCAASYNSPVFRRENKIASCVPPPNNRDSGYRTDTEAQILCLQTVPETHYWGNYFCALRLTPGCRVNPRWVNCLLTGDRAGARIFFFFFLPFPQ